MSQMVELLESFSLTDGGSTESRLEGVRFFKSTHPIPRKPIVYDPGICIIAQGRKIGYLGGRMFQYDAYNYLVTSVTMPFESYETLLVFLLASTIEMGFPKVS